jgi:hypothetical protein
VPHRSRAPQRGSANAAERRAARRLRAGSHSSAPHSAMPPLHPQVTDHSSAPHSAMPPLHPQVTDHSSAPHSATPPLHPQVTDRSSAPHSATPPPVAPPGNVRARHRGSRRRVTPQGSLAAKDPLNSASLDVLRRPYLSLTRTLAHSSTRIQQPFNQPLPLGAYPSAKHLRFEIIF